MAARERHFYDISYNGRSCRRDRGRRAFRGFFYAEKSEKVSRGQTRVFTSRDSRRRRALSSERAWLDRRGSRAAALDRVWVAYDQRCGNARTVNIDGRFFIGGFRHGLCGAGFSVRQVFDVDAENHSGR